jgi:predicted flap endonuclease-1-like 5' DNA nuclease
VEAKLPEVAVAAPAVAVPLPKVGAEAPHLNVGGDDLEIIEGIGPAYATKLRAAGVTTFAQLAATDEAKLNEIITAPAWRKPHYADWIAQAKLAAAGDEVGLKALQDTLLSGGGRARVVGLVTACPQSLAKVRGIGSVYSQKLYAAGIGTFWELTQLDEAELSRILDIKDFQKVSLAEIKAAAQKMAEETNSVGHVWDASQPDDFEPLGGIGEVYETRLYDAGICTYRALANVTVEQLAAICKAPSWRTPDYASWIAQAKAKLAEGK